jgi:hypothetical protein
MTYDNSRTQNRIYRDTLADRQRVLPAHECEQTTHHTVWQDGRRMLRCTHCGAMVPEPPRPESAPLAETWLWMGVALVILWVLLGVAQALLD